MRGHMSIHMHVHMRKHMSIHMHIHISMHMPLHMHLHMSMHIPIHMQACMCTDLCTDMCPDMCTDMCTYMCTHMCIDMRTHMCIDMHIHKCIDMCYERTTMPSSMASAVSVKSSPNPDAAAAPSTYPSPPSTHRLCIDSTRLAILLYLLEGTARLRQCVVWGL